MQQKLYLTLLGSWITLSPFAVDAQTNPAQATPTSAASNGETSSTSLDEVVVTAQKRSENLQKVPIAVNAVSPTELADTGVKTMQDLGAAVPGLTILNVAGQLSPHIRGVGSTSTAVGIEPAVATYVDGVYYANTADLRIDLSDAEQVTVLKGPQGTLFGRNATGGVIQITTPDPDQQFHLNIGTGIDNYATLRSHLFVSGGITDELAGRIAITDTTQKVGWGTNLYDDTPNHKIYDDVSVRSKLVWTPDDKDTIKLQADFTDSRDSMGANFRYFSGYGGAYNPPQSTNIWSNNSYVNSFAEYRGGGISLGIDREFDFARVVSISAYRDAYLFNTFPISASNVPTEDIPVIVSDSKQFSQELQLVSTSGGSFKWAAGLYYFWEDAGTPHFDIDFHGPFFSIPFTQLSTDSFVKTNSLAAFAQGTYELTQQTRLTIGLRDTYERKNLIGSQDAILSDIGAEILGAPAGVRIPLTGIISASESTTKPTWRLALDQDLSLNTIAYVSWNRGEKSGGYNTTNPTNPAFKPEQLDAYEVGLKTELLDRRIRLNAAGFYYDYKNLQIAEYREGSEMIINGAQAHMYGIDADLEAKLSTNFTLNAGAAWDHPKFVDFPNAPTGVPAPGAFGAIGGVALTTIPNAAGKTIPYSPTFTYSLGGSYNVPTTKGAITLSASDNYNSGYFGEPDNVLRQPAFHLVSASVAWKSPDGRVDVRLFGDNLLNKAVVSQFSTETAGYIADYSNPPRIVGIAAQYSF